MGETEQAKKPPAILVIDDDEAVRKTVCENLEICGFTVRAAADGVDGLAAVETHGPPDIVITDIVMPRKNGLETISELRRLHPGVRIVAMSGGGRSRTGDFLMLAGKLGADAVLPKPLDLDELERVVSGLAEG